MNFASQSFSEALKIETRAFRRNPKPGAKATGVKREADVNGRRKYNGK